MVLRDRVKARQIGDQTFYIVLPSEVEDIRLALRPPVVCGAINQLAVCVIAASYQRCRDLVPMP